MNNRFATLAARWRVPMGFALGVAYLIYAQPTVPLLVVGALVCLLGLGIRAYAYTRNPLYLGSLLIGLGLVIAGGRWFLAVAFLLFFLFVYGTVMRREEAGLREQYGRDFEEYAKSVPLFFPGRKAQRDCKERFEWRRYRKNREYEAAIGYVAGILFLILKILFR